MRPRVRVPLAVRLALACALGGLLVAATPARAQISVRSSVSSTRLEVGAPIDWIVSVGGTTGAGAPSIPPLDWAVVQEMGTQQNMAWINGKTSARTVHQFRLTPTREGRFSIPSVSVRTGGRIYVTDAIGVEVLAPAGGLDAGGGSAPDAEPRLRLVASLSPERVVVGEPVILTMRLYQGVRLLADPGYTPPPTPRFYSEKSGPVSSRYVTDASGRWLLGETRTVLYPTVAGRLAIGPARALCVLADPDLAGGLEVEITSRPAAVDVAPLPPAPAGFGGTVADARLSGEIDRAAVRADEAVEVTLRLAGTGNLRLAPAPALPEMPDFQVFDRRIEDSLSVDEGIAAGTKIVRYTLLPRRTGPLVVPAIAYVTYVPGEGYRTLQWAGARVDVAPGLARDTTTPAAARAARLVPTGRAGGSPWTAARPFAGAALVAFALALWLARLRLRSRRDADSPEALARRARDTAAGLAELRGTLAAARARGDAAAFWRAAEEAVGTGQGSGDGPDRGDDAGLRSRVAAARYAPGGGAAAAMDALGGELESRLAAAQAAAAGAGRTRAPRAARIAAGVLVAAGIALLALGGRAVASHPGDAALERTLATASAELSANRIPEARGRLFAAWAAGARRPGVALDLALAAWYERKLGEAALWTERARRLDPRLARVATLAEALAEEGAWEGLPVGARARTTGGEIAFVACALLAAALVVFVLGRRRAALRWVGRGLVVAAIALAVYAGQSGAAGEAPGRAVVLRAVSLAPAPGKPGDIELEPGRALWLDGPAKDGWVPVRAGSQVRGMVPADAVHAL